MPESLGRWAAAFSVNCAATKTFAPAVHGAVSGGAAACQLDSRSGVAVILWIDRSGAFVFFLLIEADAHGFFSVRTQQNRLQKPAMPGRCRSVAPTRLTPPMPPSCFRPKMPARNPPQGAAQTMQWPYAE